jgi:hypothetical protein
MATHEPATAPRSVRIAEVPGMMRRGRQPHASSINEKRCDGRRGEVTPVDDLNPARFRSQYASAPPAQPQQTDGHKSPEALLKEEKCSVCFSTTHEFSLPCH